MSLQISARSSRCGARVGPARRATAFGARSHVARRPVIVRAEDAATATGASAGPKTALDVNDANFEDLVLKSPTVVLVDFWAPWCGPCRMIAPIIDELAVDYKGKLICTKVNTDEAPQTAARYAIRSIPTVMIFKGGEKMEAIIGAVPKATLALTIDKYV